MEMSSAAKVGMVAVIALILFGLVVTQLGGISEERGKEFQISFQNVGGLQTKAPVLLAGVKVGLVKKMELSSEDSRVRVTMLITRDGVNLYRSRRPDDPKDSFYVYTVAGNLLGDKWVDIRTGRIPADTKPLDPKGEPIVGEPPVSLDDLAREGNAVMAEFRQSVTALNELVADKKFQNDIRETMGNFTEISRNLKGASTDARGLVHSLNGRVERLGNAIELVVAHVDQTVTGFQSDAQAVGADLKGFSGGLRSVVVKNQGNINTIVTTLKETAQSLNRTMKTLETLANNKDLKDDVLATVNNLKKTTAPSPLNLMVLGALDFVVPGQWQNVTGFTPLVKHITGETRIGKIDAISTYADQLYQGDLSGCQKAIWLYQTADSSDSLLSAAALGPSGGRKDRLPQLPQEVHSQR